MINGTEYKIQLWIHNAGPTWFLTKEPKTYNREKTASSINVSGKLDMHTKTKTIPRSLTLYKYQLKMD
jgi:hypothetical protein